jgi:hypothetical protein
VADVAGGVLLLLLLLVVLVLVLVLVLVAEQPWRPIVQPPHPLTLTTQC